MRSGSTYSLRPFDPLYASAVASWASTRRELFLLAPSTPYPLTAAKVAGWPKPSGQPFLMFEADDLLPCGYGELNPMRRDPRQFWLGHLLVDPMRRSRGLGRRLTLLLAKWAFRKERASRLTLVVFPENVAAIRCYERCGFRFCGEEFQTFGGKPPRHRLFKFDMILPPSLARRQASAQTASPAANSARIR